jgi:phosphoribosylformylglycinamidine synthase
VVRVHGTSKALAITTDCTPRYCYADPYEGGKQAIAEAWRNLCAVGAPPLAATDCMNFGNPQRPEIMGQFVGCIEGMAEACRALDFPIVSGNVSLYNETKARTAAAAPSSRRPRSAASA